MKNLKTKIGLSVLALACLGAGTITLNSNVSAKAEEKNINETTEIVMTKGAGICLEEDFSGIRWETTVNAGYCDGGAAAQFGVLVAPTADFGANGLTFETENVLDLAFEAGVISTETDAKYYSVISYDKLAAEFEDLGDQISAAKRQEAYSLELTARAYVKYNGDVYYAAVKDGYTSRSAKQIAVGAEVTGALDTYRPGGKKENATKLAKAIEYYGGEALVLDKRFIADSTMLITKDSYAEAGKTATLENVEISGEIEKAFLDFDPITAKIENGTLTVSSLTVGVGEHYITLFMKDGTVETVPFIHATKIIKSVDDLKMFNAKGSGAVVDGVHSFEYTVRYTHEDKWAKEQKFDGYYVLGQNIEAEGYVHGSRRTYELAEGESYEFNDHTWNGSDKYVNKPIGLTGTFNGMGYAIKDMEMGSEREGFFGVVNEGTVKNVAFLDVKAQGEYKTVIANYLIDATLENVYVRTDKFEKAEDGTVTSMGFPMQGSAGVASSYRGDTTMKSCVIEFSESFESSTAGSTVKASAIRQAGTGILFSHKGSGDDFVCADVYCISANKLGNYNQILTNYRGEQDKDTKEWSGGRAMLAEMDRSVLTSAGAIKGTREDGLYTYAHTDDVLFVAGVYRYDTYDRMKTANYTYDGLIASGCWTVVDGVPVWGK